MVDVIMNDENNKNIKDNKENENEIYKKFKNILN